MLLAFRDLSLSLGGAPLLDRTSFQIERGERVSLVGRNGAGKSTLLRVAEGSQSPDAGEVYRAPGLRLARLAQEVPAGTEGSVFHAVAEGLGSVGVLVERYHGLARAVAEGDTARMAALERCQHELEAAGGWTLEQRVEAALSRLGLDAEAGVARLSGGMRRRVLLARALVGDPDLLLLDEPTNHLDIDGITWLEELLLGWSGALLFVTHDRAFLQRLATRIVELDRGQLTDFPGDYATYLTRKAALLAAEDTRNALFDRKLATEETWVRQGIKARRTRNEGRVKALERMRRERAERRGRVGGARMAIEPAERSGRLVTEAEGAGFDWGGRPVFRGLNTTILRGDRVGIIGPNGSGKTTLLRVLLGELTPTAGQVRRGTNLEVAYFDQHRAGLDEARSVQESVADGRETLAVQGRQRHVLSYLQDFLFAPDRARQPVRALSGGERNRLLLARLFARPSNVLVLDEPTNDLDTDTLELLEDLLADYPGTVLLVSHDRAFLNNVVTSTLVFEGAGVVAEYVGGYDDWLRQRPPSPADPKAAEARPARPRPPNPGPGRLSYRDQRELEGLPRTIEALEAEVAALHAEMSAPEFYRRAGPAIAAAQARLARLDESLATAYARWEALETLRAEGRASPGAAGG
jgi:ATP-binding cassette subfamily F protein uup